MTLDFDVKSFIEDMRACKPPYRCPFKDCGKVYKTFSGINSHILSHDDDGDGVGGVGTASKPPRSPSPQPFFRSPVRDSLVYDEHTKKVEFEAEGRLHKFSIYEALELVDRRQWEASLPQKWDKKEEAEDKVKEEEPPRTPLTSRVNSKKKKTPRPKPPGTSQEGDRDGGGAGQDKAALGEEGAGAGEKQKMIKLPEAQFKEIEDYDVEDAPPMPSSYYRFIEKPAEELDEEVEYDMDEEDVAWLDIINEKRDAEGLQLIREDQFELLMDRLEKESYFHVQTNGKDGFAGAPVDEDAICCVCMDGECSNTNVILFCDLCNLAVHQECYGVPYIPEGQWLCRRCLQSPSRSVECCLCPNKGGAFKQTDDGRWAHVVCGLWIPEVRFANTVFLEPIDSIDNIPPARWKLSCRVCKQRGVGACIQCHKTNCYTAFHVTCGLLAGLHMKMDTVRESSAAGLSVTVRKTAFCDVHTPQDSDCKPQLEDVTALGISTAKQKAPSPKKLPGGTGGSAVPILFRGLMNFSPQCPWEKVQEIASLIEVQRKNQFFQRLMAYWTLKRQTRNGVPLIRRLQFAKAMKSDKGPETPQKNALTHNKQKKKKKDQPTAKEIKEKNIIARKAADDFKEMMEQRKLLRRVRQDLERVRLLCELIRKREQRKKEMIANAEEATELKCWPLVVFLRNVLESLQAIDIQGIFAEPVNLEEVPDYLDHVTRPMDFRTMRDKLDAFSYESVEQLEEDFNVMVENCLSYNERDTIFFRAGVRMRDLGGSIIRQSKRVADSVGYEGFHHAADRKEAGPPAEVSDEQIMREVDSFLGDDEGIEAMTSEELLKKLLELQDKTQLVHHPVAKVKRLRIIRSEIIKVRRKLTLDKSGKKKEAAGLGEGGGNPAKKKSYKPRDVSPLPMEVAEEEEETGGRRRRATGKEEQSKKTPAPTAAAKKGRKRGRTATETEAEQTPDGPPSRKKALLAAVAAESANKTPTKAAAGGGASLPESPATKSPAGVNRRNAVLFTRKKQAANASPAPASSSEKAAKGDKEGESLLEEQETTVPASAAATGTSAAEAKKNPGAGTAGKRGAGKGKKRGRKPKGAGPSVEAEDEEENDDEDQAKSVPPPSIGWQQSAPKTASFQEYRRGGGEVGETDEDTQSESATDAIVTDEDDEDDDGDSGDTDDSDDDDDDDDDAGAPSRLSIALEPLDLVWAKCRGYPWYPALIINPKMPRTGYLHNGVPIPVPPQDVLDMAETHTESHYLILFFDAKRTWQWLVRDKLEPLGVDSELDKAKLVQSKKPAERKAVKRAYEDAILHRCKVTGENASMSGEEEEEEEEEGQGQGEAAGEGKDGQ